jgi:predicted regulator of Ras-like GTPase activity (Roadblock/LC7/MglB family)
LLDETKSIKGYIAAGIMDFTGEVLAAHSASDGTNLAAFGAVFNDVFRGAHEASRKIGLEACRAMTLTTPKGLVIMECTGTDAPVHLHGIVVLQADGNQALARMTLDKVMPQAMGALR